MFSGIKNGGKKVGEGRKENQRENEWQEFATRKKEKYKLWGIWKVHSELLGDQGAAGGVLTVHL